MNPHPADRERPLIERDTSRHELRMALLWSFRANGYSNEESSKLADIAIGPVDQALKLAKAISELRAEATMVESPKLTLSKDALGRLIDDLERQP